MNYRLPARLSLTDPSLLCQRDRGGYEDRPIDEVNKQRWLHWLRFALLLKTTAIFFLCVYLCHCAEIFEIYGIF